MADEDELYYLQPGFDLSSLTIPRIRSILVAHNIAYPSSAKKQDLVDILQQQLVPKAKRLLNAQARVRRTSKGITDIPSSQDSTIDDEDSLEHSLPTMQPKTPRGRKSKTDLRAEESAASTPRSTYKSSKIPSGRTTTKAIDPENEADENPALTTVRRTRKSIQGRTELELPRVRLVEPSAATHRSAGVHSSPFTDENPFQSGSSPPPGSRRMSSTSRTRSAHDGAKRKSTSGRRTTRSPTIKQEETEEHSRSTFVLPVGVMSVDRNGVRTSEEFTADEEKELEKELVTDKQLVRKRNSALARQGDKPMSTAAKTAPLAILTMVLAAIGSWYRQEKINIGYCGVGEPNWSLVSNANIPLWIHENLQPQCEPCPPHAVCFPNMEVSCEHDFILQEHPFSLNGLVPLPPTCEPDSEKERRIKAVADRAVEELREHRAVYECGSSSDTVTASSTSQLESSLVDKISETKLEVSEEILKREVSKMRRKDMSDEMFEDLWQGAFANVVARDEVEVTRDGSGAVYLSSTSLAKLPFLCTIRRSLIRTVSRLRIPLAILILLSVSLGYGRNRLASFNQAKAQTPSLVAMTLDRLATQAALKEDGRTSEGFISIAQLRDDVLRNVFSASERERAWTRVRKIVEQNSNVRAATREGEKTGEWSRVWEWIGPIDFLPGLEGRRSYSLAKGDTPEHQGSGDHNREVRRWDEGRPIY